MMQNKKLFCGLAVFFLLVLCIAYSNHFDNDFHFDDSHTIENNEYIQDLNNIPLFFTDVVTFSTLPGNRSYRPVVTTLNAIDYWIGGGLKPFFFHLSIFLWYIVQGILMFFMFRKIFNISFKHEWNSMFALFGSVWFLLHTANAETINYIISRSDSFSTLCVVASLLLFQISFARRWHLYLLTMILGICTKETGVMFAPILFLYILLFEEKFSLTDMFLLKKRQSLIRALIKAAPSIVVTIGLFAFLQCYFVPKSPTLVASTQSHSIFHYFITQWYVIAHYIGNFAIPLNFSVDPDFQLIKTLSDRKILLSLGLILSMVSVAFWTSRYEKFRPISFGILWFFVALAPTSSFRPFGQIANDHRTFFPYVGLMLSSVCFIRMMIVKYRLHIQAHYLLKYGISTLIILILLANAYGVHQRNEIWGSDELLWKEAAAKGPGNGRALMNHGLTLMRSGNYDEAHEYFKKTLELLPYWAFIHVNMGILRNAMGHQKEAERYFLNAIRYQPDIVEGYYYYAEWLKGQNRLGEAKQQLEEGARISPGHTKIKHFLQTLTFEMTADIKEKIIHQVEMVEENPDAEEYLNLSLLYYNNGQFIECIEACKKSIELKPDYALAYNNLCSAYNALKEWDKAIEACEKAVKIDPDFQRASNNMKLAIDNKAKGE